MRAWDPRIFPQTFIPFTNITVCGTNLNSNYQAFAVFVAGATNPVTPVVTGYTNYLYTVTVDRMVASLAFKNDVMPEKETLLAGIGLAGYEAAKYDFVTNLIKGTTLGPVASLMIVPNKPLPTVGNAQASTAALQPTWPQTGWK